MKRKIMALAAILSVVFSLAAVLPAAVGAANYSCKTAYPTYSYYNPNDQFTVQLKVVGCYDPGSEVWGQSISVYSYSYIGFAHIGWNPTGDAKGYTTGSPVDFFLNDGQGLRPRKDMNINGNWSACYDGGSHSGLTFGCSG